ncbi:MAG: hypothetical protein ACMG6S_01995 [Byssovorax sp.]
MIAVIDPALLVTAQAEGPLSINEEAELAGYVDDAARICRELGARIPSADWYWGKLQRETVRQLHRRAQGPRLRQGLDALHARTKHVDIAAPPAAGRTQMWGAKVLFGYNRLTPEWLGVMERLLIGCAQRDDETVLITRLFEGRNLIRHAAGKSTLDEKTRWRILANVPGRPPRLIRCVRSLRNLRVPWTARFDEKLPDSGHYPFCPPERWWRGGTTSCRTFKSKPAWIDRYGNGWIQPATGGDYHWDVFLEDINLRDGVGLNQINVVAWGTAEREKTPGEIHHVPKEKEPHFRGGGWICPG